VLDPIQEVFQQGIPWSGQGAQGKEGKKEVRYGSKGVDGMIQLEADMIHAAVRFRITEVRPIVDRN
jgi:hypothetical protein